MVWEKANIGKKGPKVSLVGPAGCLKTRTILATTCRPEGPPRTLVIDYEDGCHLYAKEFRFAREPVNQIIDVKDPEFAITKAEIAVLKTDRHVYQPALDKGKVYGVDFARVTLLDRVAKNPIDHLLIDSLSMHWQWTQDKWLDVFMVREGSSQGHRKDYYTMQPRDWDKPSREILNYISRLKALNVGVWVTSQEKPEYAEGQVMKRIGTTFDGYKRMPYLMDTMVQIEDEEHGTSKSAEKRKTKYIAVVKKDRTNSLGERFLWANGDEGHSKTFVTLMTESAAWAGKPTQELEADNGDLTVVPDKPDEKPTSDTASPKTEEPKAPAADASTNGSETIAKDRKRLMRLKWLKAEVPVPNDKWKAALEKRGLASAKELSPADADSMIEKLSGKLNTPAQALTDKAFEIIEGGGDPFSELG